MEYYDLGRHGRPVTTRSPEAQLWFDRGLVWCYGFNHEEAVICFREALAHDPDCAMAHWGVAYASGPNYNLPWDLFDAPGKARALATAFDATARALALADRASPQERALIEALAARYPARTPQEDQAPWDRAYAAALRDALRRFPEDRDLRALFAEALMQLTPWKMWDLATGHPAEGAATAEAQQVLEEALERDPGAMEHPGLLHMYLHLMEMSPTPEKALRAADALRDLVPDAGHLVHMPTHIDVLCGQYPDVLEGNRRAIAADRKYYARAGGMNFYTAYRQHDYHFAIYGALFLGQYGPALAAAEELIETTPEALLRMESPPMADYLESYLAMVPHVHIRFGKWAEILAMPLPEDRGLYCTVAATILYARGIAHAALGDVAQAERAAEAFDAARAAVPESRLLHNVRVVDLLAIAEAMLTGEIAYRKGAHESAFEHLRRAVALDDALPYDEPWGWMQPTRHALGALLLEQGRLDEAEAVYRDDLGLSGRLPRALVHPDNVWSLRGLADCLERRGGDMPERIHLAQRLALAEARADGPVRASCFCARTAIT